MYQAIKWLFLLAVLTYLKIAIILANSVHSSFLSICKVIADVFQVPTTHFLSDSFPTEDRTLTLPHGIATKQSIFTQTEEECNQHENAVEKSGTDVIIYNLNSTQKLVISQGTFKRNQCENCKSETEILLRKDEGITAPTIGTEGSNISDMSIESDVLDSKIESGCSSSSNSSDGKVSLNAVGDEFYHLVDPENSKNEISNVDNESHRDEFVCSENIDNASLNTSNDRFSVSVDFDGFERLNENILNDTYSKCGDTTSKTQKTSSPLKTLFQKPRALCTDLSMLDTCQQSQTTRVDDAEISINTDFWKDDGVVRDFKRRLSLPVKLNTTTSSTNFKLAQQKLIEEALKNTPRHERSLKEIKYPFSSEISLDSRPNDGIEDKEVFSCSSYESLPVSDHLRNAFEHNTLLNLYNENLHVEDKPDFSCVDNLTEAFNDIKTTLSLDNLNHTKNIPSIASRTEIVDEKDSKSLNTDEKLHSSFNTSSLDEQKLKDNPKLSRDFKEISFSTDIGKRMISSFTSEINSRTNWRDAHNKALDRFVASEVKIVAEKFSRLCNDDNKSGENSDNEQSDASENKLSPTKENKSFENSNLKQDSKEENTEENKLNQMKYLSSVSPLKFVDTDVEKFAIGSGVLSDFENTESNITRNAKSEEFDFSDYSPKAFHQLYTKTVFIDESPPYDQKSLVNQNISETGSLDHSLNEDDKSQCKENISRCSERETNEFNEYDASLPYRNLSHKLSEESVKNKEKLYNLKCIMPSSPNKSLLTDQFEWTNDLKIPILVKDKTEQNELREALQLSNAFLDQSSRRETSPIKQDISETNSQNNSLNKDRKPAALRKRNRRYRQSKNHAKDSILKTNKSTSDNLTCEQQSFVAILESDKSLHQEKDGTCQEILKANCQEHPSLNEDKKPTIEENISSGDSASDNSVVTVKDLTVVESKIEENEISEKSD